MLRSLHDNDHARSRSSRPRSRSRARAVLALVLVLAMLLVMAGCSDRATRTPTIGGTTQRDGDEPAPPPAAPLSPVARALDRTLGGLVEAYAPVADRASYITAAHTLYVDAVAAGSGATTVAEREAALTTELGRSEVVLRGARSALVRRDATGRARVVKRRMLGAIDARMRAIAALRRHLALTARGLPAADQQAEAFDAGWNQSVRLAREALTLVQDLRAAVGAPPEREDAIR